MVEQHPSLSGRRDIHDWTSWREAQMFGWRRVQTFIIAMRLYIHLCQFAGAALLMAGCSWRREDYTRGESQVCELHHVQMVRSTVPIVYGLFSFTAEGEFRHTVSTNSFPHAETYVLGGCCITPDSAHRAVVYTCSECKKAGTEWDALHENKH